MRSWIRSLCNILPKSPLRDDFLDTHTHAYKHITWYREIQTTSRNIQNISNITLLINMFVFDNHHPHIFWARLWRALISSTYIHSRCNQTIDFKLLGKWKRHLVHVFAYWSYISTCYLSLSVPCCVFVCVYPESRPAGAFWAKYFISCESKIACIFWKKKSDRVLQITFWDCRKIDLDELILAGLFIIEKDFSAFSYVHLTAAK